MFGDRPDRSFRQTATKFLLENQHKRSIGDDALNLRMLDPFIGELTLRAVHRGSLQSYIDARKRQGVKMNTINHGLRVVRRILNLAASEWLDENGLTWLERSSKIAMLKVTDARKPYPLSFDEQTRLFRELPGHIARMTLFKVNTGCREQEVCQLRWHWEIDIPEMQTSVFLVPGDLVKNGEPRLVMLNEVAKSVIEEVRGVHPEFVFTHRGKPVLKMNNSAWKSARVRAGRRRREAARARGDPLHLRLSASHDIELRLKQVTAVHRDQRPWQAERQDHAGQQEDPGASANSSRGA